jgi:hypothetical protein
MLNPSDVYTEGGNSDLLVCWTDKVTKYDASSFYNWEMDNLPLHDLDERTHLLWERVGHPTSSITGMSFIVSGDLVSEGCSPHYFKSLSSCMAALPDVINYPILVEVVSFGQLGSLEIPAKTFGPRGKLEIINRNSSFAGAIGLSGGPMSIQETGQEDFGLDNPYFLASGVSPGGFLQKEMGDGVSAPALSLDLLRSKTFNGGHHVASGGRPWKDARFGYDDNGSYVFARRVYADGDNRLTAALDSKRDPWDMTTADFKEVSSFAFEAFDGLKAKRAANDSTMDKFDVSTLNYLTDTEVRWGNHVSAVPGNLAGQTKTQGVAAFAYYNYLDNIKVHNCNGPIFIRNFNVDSKHTFERGIDIKNSDVVLERCSVSRANKAGLYAENSNVDLVRGFVAYRNYELLGAFRTGIPFDEKRIAYQSVSSYGAGIYATNSTVNVSSTYARDILQSTNATGAFNAYPDYTGDVPCPSMEALYCLSRNDIGIHAVNSQVLGGRTELNGSGTNAWLDATQLITELNTEAGVKLENSKLANSGRLLIYGNYRGLDADGSKILTDVVKCKDNQAEGLLLNNSTFIYGKDLYANVARTTQFDGTYRFDQVGLIGNGTHLKAVNSIVEPVTTSSLPAVYSQFFTSGAFGTTNAPGPNLLRGVTPSVDISKNSEAELIHFVGNRRKDYAAGTTDDRAVYGSVLRVDKNASVVTRSSKDFATVIAGPEGRDNHILQAGVYCNNNSLVSFQGPTVIASLGVDVLADNNSKMEFVPHRNRDGDLLVSSFDLQDTYNHTSVELHSTRACLVATNKSEISMQDLGDYRSNYENDLSVHGNTLANANNFDYLNNQDNIANDDVYRGSVSGGYLQFYPNAYIDNANIFDTEGRDLNATARSATWAAYFDKKNFTAYGTSAISGVYSWYLKQFATGGESLQAIKNISSGGMCVRALKGSKVNVTNVHFPAGWGNTSGTIYNLSGAKPTCTHLRMWNIADDSVLDANYVSVSGLHPFDTIYHGPSGTWGASEAPSSTPDTSSLSVLDYYGRANNETGGTADPVNPFGFASHQNRGAFRLFFSTDPVTNWFQPSADPGGGAGIGPDATQTGVARQIYSQGYQPSSTLIANNTAQFDASGEYRSVLKFEKPEELSQFGPDGSPGVRLARGPIHASGYYYANEMVYNPNTIKANLDESAANLFANAKHNTVGKSNLAKVVSIYFPYVDTPIGGDSSPEAVGKPLGLASVNNFDLEKNN